MLTNNVMALKGKRARRVAGLNGRREYENIFLLWQNKEFLETEVFKEYHARITQMGVLYMPIMVMSIFAAGSALTHLLPFPPLLLPLRTDLLGSTDGEGPTSVSACLAFHLSIFTSFEGASFLVPAALGGGINYQALSFIAAQASSLRGQFGAPHRGALGAGVCPWH